MLVDQIADYASLNVRPYLIYFFSNSNFKSLLESFDPQHNDVEQTGFDINNDLWLATATGTQLDVLGEHLSFKRNGRDDTTYRSLLTAKAKINTSSGEPENVISIARDIYGATVVNYIPNYPAGFILEHNGALSFFITENIITNTGEDIIFDVGGVDELWEVNLDDVEAQDLIFSAIPAGVDIQIVNI